MRTTRPTTLARRSALLAAALLTATPLAAQRVRAASGVAVRAENPLAVERPDETLSLSWRELQRRLPGLRAGAVRVLDAGSRAELPAQVLDADGDQAPASAPAARAHAHHDARRDDLAWENDRVAFRTYGQGLWALEDLVSSGLDVWLKRTRALVLARWYADGHYHTDSGEGADFYSVGPTLGAGGSAVWRDGALRRARNFSSYRILADGPIRALVELEYAPWDSAGTAVAETKRISLDAGQNLFRQESLLRFAGVPQLTYAVGPVKREGLVGSSRRAGAWAWLATWGPVERKNGGHGALGTAVLMDSAHGPDARELSDHYVLLATARPGVPTVQYVGAAWTASGDFPSAEAWWRYLDAFAQRLAHPIRVTILPS